MRSPLKHPEVNGVRELSAEEIDRLYAGFPRDKKYDIILADPPYRYENNNATGAAAHHYPVLTMNQLGHLPLARIANKNCILCLWTTGPHMQHSCDLISQWGFKYRTVLSVWIKRSQNGNVSVGLGSYTRSCAEFILVAVRGSPPIRKWRASKTVSQLIAAKRGKHSVKPKAAFKAMEKLFARSLKKIELFARSPRKGWDAWGNEV
ncbi:hypothetical protein CYMTET_45052 [Cymbomonas tetramitiformis]|uniref:mRNA m(6)A methyltransferase n=1 Tax=Cymbomonas tetramitiformis TaxID=36881 RepID=A0AAE0C0P8_9CHLO|nr:hypothetical protein CYMTET_48075 [Cymbomonas tetramitiformis]KAK3245375.1 hypothetical protein CYMTET_45052 [Cymbomonas tetramitiformis]